jgi:hypothetical protein
VPIDPIGAAAAKKKAAEFEKAVNAALAKYDNFTTYTIEKVQQQIKEYRKDVLSIVAETDWQKARLDQLDAALSEAERTCARKLAATWGAVADPITAMALDSIDGPLGIIGVNSKFLPAMVPVQEIAVLNNYVPSQITNVTAEVHQKVRGLMRQAVLGGLPGVDLVARVGDVVGPLVPGKARPAGTVFSAADVRARTIMRTEMNRLHNLVKTARVNEVSAKYPGVGYKWLHRRSNFPRDSHTALHGVTVFPGLGEKFSLAGMKVGGPHDPALPGEEVINCHCTAVVVYDATKGEAEVADSPYIAGDGKQIPTAGTKTKPLPQPPGPKTSFDDAAASDPAVGQAHATALKAWQKVPDKKAAQAAYDDAFQDSIMEQAKKAAQAAEHAGTGPGAKIAYHQAKLDLFERAGLKKFADVERPKLAKWQQEVFAAGKAQADDLLAQADVMNIGLPGSELNADMQIVFKATKDPTLTATSEYAKAAKRVTEEVEKEKWWYNKAGSMKAKAVDLSSKMDDLGPDLYTALEDLGIKPDGPLNLLAQADEFALTTNAKLVEQLKAQAVSKTFASDVDALEDAITKAKFAKQKAANLAAQAAEDALTAPKPWTSADLMGLVEKPHPTVTLANMSPAQKVGYYEAKKAAAQADLDRIIAAGTGNVQYAQNQVASAAGNLATAREELAWFAGALNGVQVSQIEMAQLLRMKRLEVRAWVKARKAGKTPPLGPTPKIGADWKDLEGAAQVNYWNDPAGEASGATAWWRKTSGKWYTQATQAAQDGFRRYTGSTYSTISRHLRAGAEASAEIKRIIASMRSVYGKGICWRAPENMIVRRGITETTSHFEDFIKQKIGNFERCVDTVIEDPGFGSASVGGTNSLLHKKYRCEIFVPKGAELAHMHGLTGLEAELEVVFPPGARFRVVRARQIKDFWTLSLEYLP